MLSLLNAPTRRSGSILTTMCPRQYGAVARRMAMLGLEVSLDLLSLVTYAHFRFRHILRRPQLAARPRIHGRPRRHSLPSPALTYLLKQKTNPPSPTQAKSWPALASMSLRNELRQPQSSAPALPYDWPTWYANAIPAADGIHANNTLPLIFFSGLGYDTDDSALISGADLGNGQHFTPSSFAYADKVVFEIHNYMNDATACSDIEPGLYTSAYGAMNLSDPAFPNKAPVVMTEFGFGQADGSDGGAYAECLRDYVTTGQEGGAGGWMQWVLAGSYYVRTGEQDDDETWGK